MLVALGLTALILVLGGLVLVIKLRPASPASSLGEQKLRDAQALVNEHPDEAAGHIELGLTYLALHRDTEARSEFERALAIDPKDWLANLQLARIVAPEDPDRAIELLMTAADFAPSTEAAGPYQDLGDIYLKQEKYKAAKDAFISSLGSQPAIYEARMGLAQAYEELGQKRLALVQYRAALSLAPGDSAAKEAIARLSGEPGSPSPTP